MQVFKSKRGFFAALDKETGKKIDWKKVKYDYMERPIDLSKLAQSLEALDEAMKKGKDNKAVQIDFSLPSIPPLKFAEAQKIAAKDYEAYQKIMHSMRLKSLNKFILSSDLPAIVELFSCLEQIENFLKLVDYTDERVKKDYGISLALIDLTHNLKNFSVRYRFYWALGILWYWNVREVRDYISISFFKKEGKKEQYCRFASKDPVRRIDMVVRMKLSRFMKGLGKSMRVEFVERKKGDNIEFGVRFL